MVAYPPRGTPLWDDPLKAYIDRSGAHENMASLAAMFAGAQSGVRNGVALASWRAALVAGSANVVVV